MFEVICTGRRRLHASRTLPRLHGRLLRTRHLAQYEERHRLLPARESAAAHFRYGKSPVKRSHTRKSIARTFWKEGKINDDVQKHDNNAKKAYEESPKRYTLGYEKKFLDRITDVSLRLSATRNCPVRIGE